MAATPGPNQEPVIFCAAYPCDVAEFSGSIRMPMGAPPMEMESAKCCEGIYQTLGSFSLYLSVLYPFLKLFGCVSLTIDIVRAIVDAVTALAKALPDVTTAVKALAKIPSKINKLMTECVAYLVQVTPPLSLITWLYFIYDVVSYVLALLKCIRSLLWITIDNDTEAYSLKGSTDPFMRDQAECLLAQNNKLKEALLFKLSAIRIILDMITLIGTLVPGIPGVNVNLSTQGGHIDIAQLDDAISVLQGFKIVLQQTIIVTGGTP